MAIHLNEHFGYRKLFRFTIPSIIMMLFTGIYGAVDAVFVANFTTPSHFAAVNLIWPVLFLLGAFGFMVGAGGSALIAKTLINLLNASCVKEGASPPFLFNTATTFGDAGMTTIPAVFFWTR